MASTVRSKAASAFNLIPKEKPSSSDSAPVDMSEVIPERTLLTERPRSANPLMKKATPDSPLEVLNSGTASADSASAPVGISTDTEEGSGSMEASTESASSPCVGA